MASPWPTMTTVGSSVGENVDDYTPGGPSDDAEMPGSLGTQRLPRGQLEGAADLKEQGGHL